MKRVLVHLFELPAVFGFLCLILFRASAADMILPITLAESDKQPVTNLMNFMPGTLLLCEQGDSAISTAAGYVCGTMTQGVVLPHSPSDVVIWTAVAGGGGTNSLFCSDQDISKGGDDDPACASYAKNGLPTTGNFAVAEPVKAMVGAPETLTYSPGVGNPGYGRFAQGSSGNFLVAQYTLTSDPGSNSPEPASLALVAGGVIGLALIRRRLICR